MALWHIYDIMYMRKKQGTVTTVSEPSIDSPMYYTNWPLMNILRT